MGLGLYGVVQRISEPSGEKMRGRERERERDRVACRALSMFVTPVLARYRLELGPFARLWGVAPANSFRGWQSQKKKRERCRV